MRSSWIAAPIILVLSLSGCGTATVPLTPATTSGSGIAASTGQITGNVHGGNQPVLGAQIYLLAVGTNGYGTGGSALNTTVTSSDGSGNTTNSNANAGNNFNRLPAGSFTITGTYTCPTNDPEVTLMAYGGNPGLAAGTNNNAIEMITPLGDCNTVKANAATLSIVINEVTTAAAAYALNQFYSSTGSVGSYAYNTQGLLNAFATVNNLVNISTGNARASTPYGNGIVPQAEINSLANAIAPCVNSVSRTSAQCTALFNATIPSVNQATAQTFAAVLAIANSPGNSTAYPTRNSDIFSLSLANAPFQPALSTAPADWTLAINYTSAGIKPLSIAVDSIGNVWTANMGGSSVSLYSPIGIPAVNSPFGNGACSGCFNAPRSLAIDSGNNVWVANSGGTSAMKLNSSYSGSNLIVDTASGPFTSFGLNAPSSVAIDLYNNAWFTNPGPANITEIYGNNSGSQTISGNNLNTPENIAFDTSGNAWVTSNGNNLLSQFQANGSPAITASGGGLSAPVAIAIDGNAHLWVTNTTAAHLSEFTDTGTAVSTSSGVTGGGIGTAVSVAVDGLGNIWSLQSSGNSLAEISSAGSAISPSTGYTAASLNAPQGMAIDPSGNIWVGNSAGTSNYLTEFIGLAAPTITPLVLGLQQGQVGQRPGTPIPVGIESVTLPRYNPDGVHTYGAQLYAYGGNTGGYTWSATNLPAGITISPTGLLGGQSTVVGSTTISVTVCDAGNATNCATQNFTLASTSYLPAQGHENALLGQYAVRFTGASSNQVTQNNALGSVFGVAFAGSLAFDGLGNITGTIDINAPGDNFTNLSVTGRYSLGADGRGMLVVIPSGLNNAQFAFSVGNFVSGVAHTIHLVEFDDTNAQGGGANSAAGIGKFQTSAAFSANTLNQSFVFGMAGETPCTNYNSNNPSCTQTVAPFGPVAIAGRFTGNASNSITGGGADASGVATTYTGITLAGSYTSPSTNGRGTLTLTPTGTLFPLPPTHYVYYIVNSGEMFLQSSDNHLSYSLLSGDALAQTTTFSNSTINGSYIFSFDAPTGGDGVDIFPTNADSAIYYGTVDGGHANVTLTGDENKAGSIRLNQTLGTVSYTIDANGRMTLAPGAGVLFYLANGSQGFGVDQPSSTGDSNGIITVQQQTGSSFSNASVTGTYAFATVPQQMINSVQSGILVSTGTGTSTTTADAAQNTGILAADQSDGYSFTVAANGRTLANDSTGGTSILYLIDANTAVVLSTNSGDTAPAITYIQR